MALDQQQISSIENTLKSALRHKLQHYNPEPAIMPFHTKLLGKDRLALYSFIHSLNTNFGTSIFEPVAIALASSMFASAQSQQVAGTQISSEAHKAIQHIMDDLATATATPDKHREIEIIRSVCRTGEMRTVKPTKVDVKLIDNAGTIYLIDIKDSKT
ncbi:MjaII restriction endonuclease [Bacteroidales bacterium Barb6XT]|nr:MjaII restriction endonuclease [Bacteroidales bacterium Barb6XT]